MLHLNLCLDSSDFQEMVFWWSPGVIYCLTLLCLAIVIVLLFISSVWKGSTWVTGKLAMSQCHIWRFIYSVQCHFLPLYKCTNQNVNVMCQSLRTKWVSLFECKTSRVSRSQLKIMEVSRDHFYPCRALSSWYVQVFEAYVGRLYQMN